ncbi:hypothetical protein B0H34DRAFT_795339 [Crassisporium funariophilum]|nr:hypothetical protein B0H34DRAFT_795339 [Crassisporium funariophilum]
MDPDLVLPRRKAAVKASVYLAANIDSDSAEGDSGPDMDSMEAYSASSRKGRASAQMDYGKMREMKGMPGRTKGTALKSTTVPSIKPFAMLPLPTKPAVPAPPAASGSSQIPPRPRPRPITKKAPAPSLPPQQGNAENDESDLTSLSSGALSSNSASFENEIQEIPAQSKSLLTRVGIKHEPSAHSNKPSWSLKSIGPYVWVLLDPKSSRVYDPEKDEDDHKARLWWPAKIRSPQNTDRPLKISLFGDGFERTDIKSPCAQNMLSKLDTIERLRFKTPTFVSSSTDSSDTNILASPRKKRKIDRKVIEKKWHAAVHEMMLDGEEQAGSDYLPGVGEAFNSNWLFGPSPSGAISAPAKLSSTETPASVKKPGKGKRKRRESDEETDFEDDFWESPPLEEDIEMPGELVLARDKASKNVDYWPAQITDYIPPANRRQQAKFTVTWLDTSTSNIPRDWFYRTHEDGFALCKLGQFESDFLEVQNDDDGEDNTDTNEDIARSPSPTPRDPLPSADDFKNNLSIREQFAYTKPVLTAILNDEYGPVKLKHENYMKGGKYKRDVMDQAAMRGTMNPKDVEQLQLYIRRWCLSEDLSGATEVEDRDEDIVQRMPGVGGKVKERDSGKVTHGGRTGSPAATETVWMSSPPEMPPSSSQCPSLERTYSFSSDASVSLASEVPPSTAGSMVTLTPAQTPKALSDDIGENSSHSTDFQEPSCVARPRGCEEYESLNLIGKLDYCLNIMLPEAVRQILLWRQGYRRSLEPLSPTEEEQLYQQGQKLLEERDWVFDIMRIRAIQLKALAKTKKGSGAQSHKRTGSTSRPRRNVGNINYVD